MLCYTAGLCEANTVYFYTFISCDSWKGPIFPLYDQYMKWKKKKCLKHYVFIENFSFKLFLSEFFFTSKNRFHPNFFDLYFILFSSCITYLEDAVIHLQI